MALVTLAAFCMALLYFIFKVFERREVPLLPAIVVNYFTAALCGAIVTSPWSIGIPSTLLAPAAGLGLLFITIFYLTALSTQRAGVAATSVAGKMSLVLTVLFTVIFMHERPTEMGWAGIVLALIAVPLASYTIGAPGARGAWVLPTLLFFGNAAIDISLNLVQRNLLEPRTEALFPMLVFAVAGLLGLAYLLLRSQHAALADPKALIGGMVLGAVNYASLYFLVAALARSGFGTSSVFPLMNIGVILFSTAIGLFLLRDRLSRVQWTGIALAVLAMVMILRA